MSFVFEYLFMGFSTSYNIFSNENDGVCILNSLG